MPRRHDLYTWDPDEEDRIPDVGERHRCTPERLLDFIRDCQREYGRFPLLSEIKQKYGGLWGAFVSYWELERRGLIKDGKLVEKSQ